MKSKDTIFGDLQITEDRALKDAYRYQLYRDLGGRLPDMFDHRERIYHPSVNFLMLNPSTADAHKLDPTLRRCVGFARRWGCKDFYVTNLFAYRTSDPKELWAVAANGLDIVGPENDTYIREIVSEASLTIVAWGGVYKSLSWRVEQVVEIIKPHREKIRSLGFTKGGQPRHPLYIQKHAPLQLLADL